MGSSAGISELNAHENSVVYPNPVTANGKLHYNLNEASIVELKIYAMNGVSVVKELKKFYEKGELTIDYQRIVYRQVNMYTRFKLLVVSLKGN